MDNTYTETISVADCDGDGLDLVFAVGPVGEMFTTERGLSGALQGHDSARMVAIIGTGLGEGSYDDNGVHLRHINVTKAQILGMARGLIEVARHMED